MSVPNSQPAAAAAPTGLAGKWHAIPLYLRILGACLCGVLVGLALGGLENLVQNRLQDIAYVRDLKPLTWAAALAVPSRLVLRLLGALAGPLILAAVVQALMHAKIPKGNGIKLISLLFLNTLVAILIGLFVVNLVQPGKWRKPQKPAEGQEEIKLKADPVAQFLDNIPKSLLGPFTDNGQMTSVILIALAVGIAMRRLPQDKFHSASELVELVFDVLITMLYWIIEVIPLAVFGIVASIVAKEGFGKFIDLGAFVAAVLLALALHLMYYLVRIRFGSWARPLYVLRGMRDALVMAFSTASSTATMPVTYACLREKVGLREQSASLGALVGANFNNDGTALYQAMAALFVAQISGLELSLTDQLLVVLTTIAASVGSAGIPEAGQVTLLLVFRAVHLDVQYIPVLLTVDWFLDRWRTAFKVMGYVNFSCLLDGKTREEHMPDEQDQELAQLA